MTSISGVRDEVPAENAFWNILGYRTLLTDRKIAIFLHSVMHKSNIFV